MDRIRILSLDPGTNHTGYSILDMDIDGNIDIVYSGTLEGVELAKPNSFIEHIHGHRFSKIISIGARLFELFELYKPEVVISEAPYLGKFPQSFAALTEMLYEFRRRVFEYDPSIYFHTVDPSTVKKNLKVSGKSGDKNLVKIAVFNQQLTYLTCDRERLDDHGIDSIAVGLIFLHQLIMS